MRVVTTEKLPIKMWLDEIEDGALEQARNLANLPFVHKWVALMPDCHQGYGMPIGGVLATNGVVIPNAVGVDIGCGMCAVKTPLKNVSYEETKSMLEKIAGVVPVGFKNHAEDQHWEGFKTAPDIEVIQRELPKARRALGTLGGGNHFIELQEDEKKNLWIMIHSGSRNFGYQIAKTYHDKAKKLCERWFSDIPTLDLSFLPMGSQEGREYLQAMNYTLRFAKANRDYMLGRSLEALRINDVDKHGYINIHHNYAATEEHYGKKVIVHRKGATKATKGLTGIIPGSMGTSSYIVKGLGNPLSFNSCSHGAGRLMGRKEAKRVLDINKELDKMDGIAYDLRPDGLDESPGAYKDIDAVMENQKDLVEIVVKLRPLGVIKG